MAKKGAQSAKEEEIPPEDFIEQPIPHEGDEIPEEEMQYMDADLLKLQRTFWDLKKETAVKLHVYRVEDDKSLIRIGVINDAQHFVSSIENFESNIEEYGGKRGWKNGEYEFRPRGPEGQYFGGVKDFRRRFGSFPETVPGHQTVLNMPAQKDVKEVLRESLETVKLLKDAGGSGDGGGIKEVFDVATRISEMQKDKEPVKKESFMDEAEKFAKIMTLFGMNRGKEEKTEDPLDFLVKLKNAGLIPEKESFEEQIAKFKAMGLIQDREPEEKKDLVSKIKELNEVKDIIAGISGGGGGESTTSWIFKAAEIVAPQISNIGQNALSVWIKHLETKEKQLELENKRADIRLMELSGKARPALTSKPQPKPVTQRPVTTAPEERSADVTETVLNEELGPDKVIEFPKKEEETEDMGILKMRDMFNQLQKAIVAGDDNEFPNIEKTILDELPDGESLLLSIATEEIDAQKVQSTLTMASLGKFRDEKSKRYIEKFVEYVKKRAIECVCNKCHDSFILISKEFYDSLEEKRCNNEGCTGTIELSIAG